MPIKALNSLSLAVLLCLSRMLYADSISEDELRALMHEAHEAFEHESEEMTFLEKVADKADFKSFSLNAYRWHQSHQHEPHVANAAANIVLLLSTSHLIETVGGVSMASLGVANGLESTSDKMMTVVGMIIPIPGLDPLCSLLVGAYRKWAKAFDRSLTVTRHFLLRSASLANGVIGLPDGWLSTALQAVQKSKFMKRYLAGGDRYGVRTVFDNMESVILGAQPEQTIRLFMARRPDGQLQLTRVHFSPESGAIGRVYLNDLLKPFGANIRSLIIDIDTLRSNKRWNRFGEFDFIEGFENAPEGLTVTLRRGAFPFHNLRQKDFDCEKALQNKRRT